MLYFIKKYKVLTILLALFIISIYFLSDKNGKAPTVTANHQTDHRQHDKLSHKKRIAHQGSRSIAQEKNTKTIELHKNFSFKKEIQNINKLSTQLPESEAQLISIITSEDLYKARAKEIKPHSIDEVTQSKMGTVKVMALKALMDQSTDASLLKSRLNFIIKKAKDPTIVNIAKAALDSTKKGRPFFKDITDGIADLPI